MSFETLLSEPVTIFTRTVTGQDSSGVDVTTFVEQDPVMAFVVRSASPGAVAEENVGGRDLVRADWSFITAPDLEVTAYDRALIGDDLMEVVGQPRSAVIPGSGPNHIVVSVRFLED